MDPVSTADVLELIRINESAIVTQFQTWLTITFAVIVAAFFGKEHLHGRIMWLTTALYLSASIVIIGLSIYFAESNAVYFEVLRRRSVAFVSPVFAGAALFTLVLVGMFTACYFIHMQSEKGDKEDG